MRLCTLEFLTVIGQEKELSFHVMSKRLLYSGLSPEIEIQTGICDCIFPESRCPLH